MKCFAHLTTAVVCKSKDTLLLDDLYVDFVITTMSPPVNSIRKISEHPSRPVTKCSTSSCSVVSYVSDRETGIVWRNVILFLILHAIYFYSFYLFFTEDAIATWIFSMPFLKPELTAINVLLL